MKRKLSLLLALVMLITLIPVTPSHAVTDNKMDNPKRVTPDTHIKEDDKLFLTIGKGSNALTVPGPQEGDKFELNLEGDPIWDYQVGGNYVIVKDGDTYKAVPTSGGSAGAYYPVDPADTQKSASTAKTYESKADGINSVMEIPFTDLVGKKLSVDIEGSKGTYDFADTTGVADVKAKIAGLTKINDEDITDNDPNLKVTKKGTPAGAATPVKISADAGGAIGTTGRDGDANILTISLTDMAGKIVTITVGDKTTTLDFSDSADKTEVKTKIDGGITINGGATYTVDADNLVVKKGDEPGAAQKPAGKLSASLGDPAMTVYTYEFKKLQGKDLNIRLSNGTEKTIEHANTDTLANAVKDIKTQGFNAEAVGTDRLAISVEEDTRVYLSVAEPMTSGGSSTGALVEFVVVSQRSIEGTVLSGISANDYTFKFPMLVNMNGAAEGDAKVNLISRNRGITEGTYIYAKVAESSILLSVERVEKIARIGENKVNLQLTEIEDGAFEKEGEVVLRLPVNFKWREGSTSVTLNGEKLDFDTKDADGRDLTIKGFKGFKSSITDKVYINSEIEVLREARQGTVNVTVKKGTYVSPRSLDIAEYVDEAVKVTANKVIDVIAGKDVEGLYRTELYIEENVENALIDQRYMEFTFVNDKEESDGVKAYLQDGEEMRLERLKGAADMDIKGDSNDVLDNVDGKIVGVKNGHGKNGHTWDLKVTAGSGSKGADSSKTKAKFKLTVPFVVNSNFTGDLYLNVKGAGVIGDAKNGGQNVKIASVKAPVTIKAEAPLAQVKIGLQTQMGSDIIVTETEAGALQDYIPKTAYKAVVGKDGTFDGSDDYATYSVSPIPSSRRSWFIFDDAKIERTNGDISLDTNRSGVSDDEHGIDVVVDRVSTKVSTIKISDVKLTLKREVPYGDVQMGGFFGVVAHRHGHNKTPITNRVQKFDYIKTLTPVSDDKRISTIFKIGEAGYTTVIGGITEKHEADVAPYIENDRTMVPLRQIGESLGAIVNWDANTKTATFTRGQVVTVIPIESSTMYINGSPRSLYAKPANVEGRILLPIVNASEAFGLEFGREVIWNADNKTVVILPQKATQAEIDDAQKVASKM